MADILIDNEAIPAIPAAGKTIIAVNSSTKQLITRDDAGRFSSLSGSIRNWNTADVVASGADTYLTGSNLAIPTGQVMQVGTTFRWRFTMSKTGAGTAAPVWTVRVGTAGTTADAARLTFTQVALQSGVIDTGWVEIMAILRNVGASGILAGSLYMAHILAGTEAVAATGFSVQSVNVMQVTSAGFDTTVANTIVGVSVNPGASGVWTHQVISAEALGV